MVKQQDSIIDASVPNAGRIYDYMLGGHHNFEVDRIAAEQLLKIVPFLSKAMRLQRWCLQDLAEELTVRRGFDTVIDFGSGLPTQDHIHAIAPAGTTVIYCDYDPVVAEYAREILGDTPNVYFFEADARQPEELLHRPEVEQILGDKREVAFVYWGVALFMSDDELAHAARTLYDWAGEKSCWAFNAQGADAKVDSDDPEAARGLDIYKRSGAPVYIRTLERYLELIQPWKPDEQGFRTLLDWHGFDQSEMSEEDRRIYGNTGGGYGAYLSK